jgi:hypothetical protein
LFDNITATVIKQPTDSYPNEKVFQMVHKSWGGILVSDEFDDAKFTRRDLRPQTVYEEDQELEALLDRRNQAYQSKIESRENQERESRNLAKISRWAKRVSKQPLLESYQDYLKDFWGDGQNE